MGGGVNRGFELKLLLITGNALKPGLVAGKGIKWGRRERYHRQKYWNCLYCMGLLMLNFDYLRNI